MLNQGEKIILQSLSSRSIHSLAIRCKTISHSVCECQETRVPWILSTAPYVAKKGLSEDTGAGLLRQKEPKNQKKKVRIKKRGGLSASGYRRSDLRAQ